jgi:hypothetical protein
MAPALLPQGCVLELLSFPHCEIDHDCGVAREPSRRLRRAGLPGRSSEKAGGGKVGQLRVTSFKGDVTYAWDHTQVATGDPEALAAIREVERIFADQISKGATAFRVEPGVTATRMDRFDPRAEIIVTVPRVAGG